MLATSCRIRCGSCKPCPERRLASSASPRWHASEGSPRSFSQACSSTSATSWQLSSTYNLNLEDLAAVDCSPLPVMLTLVSRGAHVSPSWAGADAAAAAGLCTCTPYTHALPALLSLSLCHASQHLVICVQEASDTQQPVSTAACKELSQTQVVVQRQASFTGCYSSMQAIEGTSCSSTGCCIPFKARRFCLAAGTSS